jgi:hypothetical protein
MRVEPRLGRGTFRALATPEWLFALEIRLPASSEARAGLHPPAMSGMQASAPISTALLMRFTLMANLHRSWG